MRTALRIIAPLALAAMLSCAGEKPAQERRWETIEQVVTHRVASGETWRSIARDFYGDEGRAAGLAIDNGMDAGTEPHAGSAVRLPLGERELRRVQKRLDAAREYNEGLDLAADGNYAGATAKFEEAMKLDPTFHDAAFNLALAYEKLGFHKRAASILKDLLSIDPSDVGYRYALAASLFGAGDLGGAEKAFREVLAASPEDRRAVFSLAVVLEKQGKAEEAKPRFRQYLTLDPHGEWAEAARDHLEALEPSKGGKH
jgi:tetratricopeptide (TPR) repeat protein